MRSVRCEIEIDAPPEAVWDVLVAFDAWSDWNPVIPTLRIAELAVGKPMRMAIDLGVGPRMGFVGRVRDAEPAAALGWGGGVPGVFLAHHWLELHPLDGERTRVVHAEDFTGVAVGAIWAIVLHRVETRYPDMNAALKARVEAVHQA